VVGQLVPEEPPTAIIVTVAVPMHVPVAALEQLQLSEQSTDKPDFNV
jgi:hypothetical protein